MIINFSAFSFALRKVYGLFRQRTLFVIPSKIVFSNQCSVVNLKIIIILIAICKKINITISSLSCVLHTFLLVSCIIFISYHFLKLYCLSSSSSTFTLSKIYPHLTNWNSSILKKDQNLAKINLKDYIRNLHSCF